MTYNDELEQAKWKALRTADALPVWEEAVIRTYRASVSTEEFNGKATKEATRKVAKYLEGTDYCIDALDESESVGLIQTLFDFLAYTEPPSECIHPGVFARNNAFEYCHSCGEDIPRQHL
jgi:hypothetical protein